MTQRQAVGLSIGLLAALILTPVVLVTWLMAREQQQEANNYALITAIKRKDTESAIRLLDAGVDANARDEPAKTESMWQWMLDRLHGKRPPPSSAPTALLLALEPFPNSRGRIVVLPDNLRIVQALLRAGARVNLRDSEGNTPLLLAAESDKCEIAAALIDRGADINASNSQGLTLLIEAAFYGDIPMMKLVLDKGVHIDAQSISGWTALMYAIDQEHYQAAKLLIDHHACVTIKTPDGVTALGIANTALHRSSAIIHLLKQKGARQ